MKNDTRLLLAIGGLGGLLYGVDFRLGVDLQKPFFEHLYFHQPYRFGGGLQLPVHIGDAYAVAVHNGEVTDAAAHETLGAPTAHATHAKDDDTLVLNAFHHLLA